MNIKGIIKDAVILIIITVIAGVILGYVYSITEQPIADAQQKATMEGYKAVMSEADSFDEITDSVDLNATDYGKSGSEVTKGLTAKKDNEILGYVVQVTTHDGFGGDIDVIIGIDLDHNVTGVEILSIDETAGLGMRAKEEDFRNQYVNKGVDSFEVNGSGDNKIDALTGATITSKAMTGAVNCALDYTAKLGGND